jgi:hypothetical protein
MFLRVGERYGREGVKFEAPRSNTRVGRPGRRLDFNRTS